MNRNKFSKSSFSILSMLMLVIFAGCDSGSDRSDSEAERITPQPIIIEDQKILEQIDRSAMPDSGYRFANAEYEDQISPYATYYIRESLRSAGKDLTELDQKAIERLLKKSENRPSFDLTDTHATVMLIKDPDKIPDPIKQHIARELDSLYVDKPGSYRLPMAQNEDVYIEAAYPTFLAVEIARTLNIKIKPIDRWLKEAASNKFVPEEVSRENSRAYVMLLKLMEMNGIEVSQEAVESVRKMFEDDLKHPASLQTGADIYLPLYLMDYVEFSQFAGYDPSAYASTIVDLLVDDKGIKTGIIEPYDYFGLYAAVYALNQAGYDFEQSPDFDQVFDPYQDFLLDDSIYLSPGNAESNFVDTFYVDAITHRLNGNDERYAKTIEKYTQANKQELLKDGLVNTYYFLELLDQNNLLQTLNGEKKQIADELRSSLDQTINSDLPIPDQLPILNAGIKALNLLEEDWMLPAGTANRMIDTKGLSENLAENTLQLTELADFMRLIDRKNEKVCKQMVENLIRLEDSDTENKLYLQSKALRVLNQSNYPIPDRILRSTQNTLIGSQHSTGLFKGGDTDEDVVSFRSTYDALSVNEIIN